MQEVVAGHTGVYERRYWIDGGCHTMLQGYYMYVQIDCLYKMSLLISISVQIKCLN